MTTYSAGDGRIIITCNVGHCPTTFTTPAPSSEAARAIAAGHDYGWYTRRQRGKVADACQWHLGGCCIHHARPSSPTLDPAAILPAGLEAEGEPSPTPTSSKPTYEAVALPGLELIGATP